MLWFVSLFYMFSCLWQSILSLVVCDCYSTLSSNLFDYLTYFVFFLVFFFFNDPATTEFYTYLQTLSLHDALPIYLTGIFGHTYQLREAAAVVPQHRLQEIEEAGAEAEGEQRPDERQHDQLMRPGRSRPSIPDRAHGDSDPQQVDQKLSGFLCPETKDRAVGNGIDALTCALMYLHGIVT